MVCREVHDPADASLDLEPIMVEEGEVSDPLLAAILESEVGLMTEGFNSDAMLARRAPKLLASSREGKVFRVMGYAVLLAMLRCCQDWLR